MGSDDGAKGKRIFSEWYIWKMVALSQLLVVFFLLLLSSWTTSPEELFTPTFSSSELFPLHNHSGHLPPNQCHSQAKRLQYCQQSTSTTWVVACHRRWCSSWGHCEACAGIGDRSRYLLGQVTWAMEHYCHSIRIDSPQHRTSLQLLDTALYQDPWGWFAEMFRFRSYDVEGRYLNLTQVATAPRGSTLFSHFFPKNEHGKIHTQLSHYDPCYFHLLYRPSPALQAQIDHHNRAILRLGESNIINNNNNNNSTTARTTTTLQSPPLTPQRTPSIGIHFRTGDSTAFGTGNQDVRVKHDVLSQSLDRMLQCAHELSTLLFGQMNQTTTTTTTTTTQRLVVPFFLATDNARVKELVKQKKKTIVQQHPIYTTHASPESYLQGNQGERSAWLELYLLAQRDGLVVNLRPHKSHGYNGSAARTSQFSRLAAKIGFIPSSHVRECIIF